MTTSCADRNVPVPFGGRDSMATSRANILLTDNVVLELLRHRSRFRPAHTHRQSPTQSPGSRSFTVAPNLVGRQSEPNVLEASPIFLHALISRLHCVTCMNSHL